MIEAGDWRLELSYYFEILRRRALVILATAGVTLLVVAAGVSRMTPVYAASSLVRITQLPDGAVSYQDLNYTVRIMNTYARALGTRPIMEEVIRRLDLDSPGGRADVLAAQIEADPIDNTELMKITIEHSDPVLAMQIANTLATVLVEQGEKIYTGGGKSSSEILREQLLNVEQRLQENRERLQEALAANVGEDQTRVIQELNTEIRIQEQTYERLLEEYEQTQIAEAMRANSVSIVETAAVPTSPIKPRVKLYLALAALVGLAGGVGLAFLLESLAQSAAPDPSHALQHASHPRIPAEEDTPPVSSPSVSVSTPARPRQSLPNHETNGHRRRESAIHTIGARALPAKLDGEMRSVLVTSVQPDDEQYAALVKIARTLTEAGQNVILVDANLRRPYLHRMFGLTNLWGFSDLVRERSGSARRSGRLVQATSHLYDTPIPGVRVLTSGSLPPNPEELLQSEGVRDVIDELVVESDIVLIVAPPLAGPAVGAPAANDALLLAPFVDGMLLVANTEQTPSQRIQRALQRLQGAGTRSGRVLPIGLQP